MSHGAGLVRTTCSSGSSSGPGAGAGQPGAGSSEGLLDPFYPRTHAALLKVAQMVREARERAGGHTGRPGGQSPGRDRARRRSIPPPRRRAYRPSQVGGGFLGRVERAAPALELRPTRSAPAAPAPGSQVFPAVLRGLPARDRSRRQSSCASSFLFSGRAASDPSREGRVPGRRHSGRGTRPLLGRGRLFSGAARRGASSSERGVRRPGFPERSGAGRESIRAAAVKLQRGSRGRWTAAVTGERRFWGAGVARLGVILETGRTKAQAPSATRAAGTSTRADLPGLSPCSALFSPFPFFFFSSLKYLNLKENTFPVCWICFETELGCSVTPLIVLFAAGMVDGEVVILKGGVKEGMWVSHPVTEPEPGPGQLHQPQGWARDEVCPSIHSAVALDAECVQRALVFCLARPERKGD